MSLIDIKRNREATFWALHAIAWAGYGTAHYLGSLLHDKPDDYVDSYLRVLVMAAVAGFVVSAPLRYICRGLWKSNSPLVITTGGLAAAYVTALAWRVCVNLALVNLMPHEEWMDEMTRLTDWFMGAISAMYIMTCWVGLYFGFRSYESSQAQREAALRSSALAQEAQLKMLRYQLNPHFLFNTLNAISTLIIDNRNSTANSAVTGLSEFLRYTLDQDPMKKVTVAQELEALNLYLSIEQMRFGDRLVLDFAIDDAASTVLMPSLLMQPLIENAIKYSVSPRESGGKIRIGAHLTGGMLQLEVADDGPGMIDATRIVNGRGVGIRNTRERLQVLYGERGAVTVSNTEPGLRVALTFPAERAVTPA